MGQTSLGLSDQKTKRRLLRSLQHHGTWWSLDEAERAMRIADDVLRHKLLRLPDDEAARRGLAVTANS